MVKKLYPSKFGKYLGVLIDSHLNFSFHINSISTRLSRAIGMLAKIRYYVTRDTLRSIYFGIFSSILTYGCQIWGQIKNKHFIRLVTLQNRAIKIMNFVNFRETASPLFCMFLIVFCSSAMVKVLFSSWEIGISIFSRISFIFPVCLLKRVLKVIFRFLAIYFFWELVIHFVFSKSLPVFPETYVVVPGLVELADFFSPKFVFF